MKVLIQNYTRLGGFAVFSQVSKSKICRLVCVRACVSASLNLRRNDLIVPASCHTLQGFFQFKART